MKKIFSSAMKKIMRKGPSAKDIKSARDRVRNNPKFNDLKNRSYILKHNRKQGYPLGDIPSAASEISKKTGMRRSAKKQMGLFFSKLSGYPRGKKATYGSKAFKWRGKK
jgi:hypothetical protein